MVPPRPCRDQAVPPNWMNKQGGDWSEGPMATLKELHAFMAKTGHCLHVTTISQALHKCGLYVRVARRKPLLKKAHLESCLRCAKKPLQRFWSHMAKSFVVWQNEDGTFWPKCKTLCLVQTQHSTSPKEHHPDCEAWWWQHHVIGLFLISRDWGTCQERRKWMEQNTEILEENLPSARKVKLGQKFTFQHDNNP